MADRVITVCKHDPMGRDDPPTPGVTLDITEPIPTGLWEQGGMPAHRAFYLDQADSVHLALKALPGGTLDALFAVMAADRASLWRVAWPSVDPKPVDDDVVDACIHDPWCGPENPCTACIAELRAQIRAALTIHRPAEWNERVCRYCSYDDREVDWPCPTAQALGVPSVQRPSLDEQRLQDRLSFAERRIARALELVRDEQVLPSMRVVRAIECLDPEEPPF